MKMNKMVINLIKIVRLRNRLNGFVQQAHRWRRRLRQMH